MIAHLEMDHLNQPSNGQIVLYCEQQFKRVKGFAGIAQVFATIEAEHAEPQSAPTKKAA